MSMFLPGLFKEKEARAAIVGGLIGGFLPSIVSVFCVYYTYTTNVTVQIRQQKFEVITRYSQSSDKIVDSLNTITSSMNNQRPMDEAKTAVSQFAGRQIMEVSDIKRTFPKVKELNDYMESIEEYNRTVQSVSSAADVKDWVMAFDRAINARTAALAALYKEIGIENN